jgi:type III restriction enzyme
LQYNIELPDIITDLQNKTSLTRKTIIDILVNSKRLDDFKRNPQKYIEEVTKIIKKNLRSMVVDGISYSKMRGEDNAYLIEMFKNDELLAYLNDKIVESKKSPYNYAICDSDVETRFAKEFENREEVKVYVKLPSWFKIETPIGSYNPDWAVVINEFDEERLYFVVETKGKSDISLLREEERTKIMCARKHFEALGEKVEFMAPESSPSEFMEKARGVLAKA